MMAVIVTPSHMACGAVTAMRSLSSALRYRHRQEDETSHRPVGRGRRDGHGGCRPDRPGHRQAARERVSGWRYDPPRGRCGRGRHRVRPHCASGLHVQPVVFAAAAAKEVFEPPTARGALTPARPRTAPGGRPARGQWSGRTRPGVTLGPTAGAGSDDRVLAGRAARTAPGGPRASEPGRHLGPRLPPRCRSRCRSRRDARGPGGRRWL